MPNNYYERLSEMNPGELADGLAIEQEFDAIGRGFAKLPEPHRDGSGFEGPTRVGDPVGSDDAVNLGSLEKLNLPIYRKEITTEDWNGIVTQGVYDVVGATGANNPSVHNYGFLEVHVFNGVINQIYYPDISDACVMAKRTCQNIELGVWQKWSLISRDTLMSTCLVNSAGVTTECHETVTPQLPPNIAVNSRYVLPNPFGINTPVICWAEIYFNNRWSKTGWIFASGSAGCIASYVQGEGIVVQTGINYICTYSANAGGGHGLSANSISAPCRVFVCKLEK
ncbi:pyocin knob domain-containing protein [Aeromonas sp. A5]|uniref:pyocin knob domain-containing protein n=1 Tax=unclassified Aeromonas TaxID=257493 RepID=UPI00376F9364